ncbi:hypothetical protein HQQ80_04595 [Microbacteriaceae bacterium VKM Ac-2855]|nr:hypothetical protein [Microbacteriaceae bacterium VKM Ac-2855]
MSELPTPDTDSSVVARAVAAGARVVACVCVLVPAAALAIRSASFGGPPAGLLGVAAVFAMVLLMIRMPWRRVHVISGLYVLAGCVAIVGYVQSTATLQSGANRYFLTMIEVGVLLVGAAQRRTIAAIVWVSAGLIAGELTRGVTLAAAGQVYSADLVLLVGFALAVGVLLAAARSHRIARTMQVSLQSAAREDEMSHVRRTMELQATAFMHDTVLGHLAAISAAEPGALTEHARTQISRDIALLLGRHWLVDADRHDPAVGSWEDSPVRAAIAEVHGSDFEVTISGDLGAVERVSVEQENALALATRQSLVNAQKHAQTSGAEVVLLASRDAVTVMVIDDGVGFDPEATPADRFGVSHSIRGRVEAVGGTVAIWSSIGAGTSVVMSVPVDVEVSEPAGPASEAQP